MLFIAFLSSGKCQDALLKQAMAIYKYLHAYHSCFITSHSMLHKLWNWSSTFK